MSRWLIAGAALLLLLLLVWFGTPEGPRPDPERPSAGAPTTESTPPSTPEPALPATENDGTTEAPAETEPEPVGDLGPGREGQVPEALLGTGDSTLHLWLIDAATEAPVAMTVTLWRLGVQEGDGWSGGDQIQRTMRVAVGGAVVSGLPPGRYRVQCDGQRKGAPDPAAFTLSSGENTRHVEVLLARSFRVRLRVFEMDGNEVREGALETGRSGDSLQTTTMAPKWVSPRLPRRGRGYTLSGGHGDSFVTTWDPRPNPLAGDLGFDLGAHAESTRLGNRSKMHRLRVEGRCDVVASVSSDLARNVTFCGLSVPLETMLDGVRWPEGAKDPKIEAKCFARLHEGDDPIATAKRASFYVRIKLKGYRPLSYRWSPGATPKMKEFVPAR